jgi:hypothetical protein
MTRNGKVFFMVLRESGMKANSEQVNSVLFGTFNIGSKQWSW